MHPRRDAPRDATERLVPRGRRREVGGTAGDHTHGRRRCKSRTQRRVVVDRATHAGVGRHDISRTLGTTWRHDISRTLGTTVAAAPVEALRQRRWARVKRRRTRHSLHSSRRRRHSRRATRRRSRSPTRRCIQLAGRDGRGSGVPNACHVRGGRAGTRRQHTWHRREGAPESSARSRLVGKRCPHFRGRG